MNTKLLTLFAAILIYFTLAPDIENKNDKLITDLRLVEHKIASDENTSELLEKTSKLVLRDRANNVANRALFIDSKLPDALAFASLQQKIKDDVNASSVELSNLSWGEPSTKEDSPYTLLPLTVAVKGTPKSCSDFLNRIHRYHKLIYIENLSIVQYMNTLSIVADLYSYQLKSSPTSKEQKK